MVANYNPTAFKDYSLSHCGHDEEDVVGRVEALAMKQFRNLEIADLPRGLALNAEDPELYYHLEDAPDFDVSNLQRSRLGKVYESAKPTGTIAELTNIFYLDIESYIRARFGDERNYEIKSADMYALKKHIILDIIELRGDFERDFKFYIPQGTSYFNRGCPEYISLENDELDPILRHDLILESISALERHCNIGNLLDAMIRFYNSIPTAVAGFRGWPSRFRETEGSLHFYEVLLQNAESLLLPEEVAQAIRCVLVIPASNADPERSFSVTNRLSRKERSNINTDTLDDLMTVQSDSPSLLTVKPEQLAYQWMHWHSALGLTPGKASTFEKEGSIMKDVKASLSRGDVESLIALHVKRPMIVHGLNHRRDAEEIKHRLLQNERAKSSMISMVQLDSYYKVHNN